MRWWSPAPVRHRPCLIEPCVPTNGRTVHTGPMWAYEIKHDGFRFVCRRHVYAGLFYSSLFDRTLPVLGFTK